MRAVRRFHRQGWILALLLIAGAFVLPVAVVAQDSQNPQSLISELEQIQKILTNEELTAEERVEKARKFTESALAAARGPDANTTYEPLVPSDPGAGVDPFFGMPHGAAAWDPFQELQRMRALHDQMFSDAFQRFRSSPRFGNLTQHFSYAPNTDLAEADDAYTVKVDLPGMDKDNISVSVEGRTLTISGERKETVQQTDEDGQVLRQERSLGKFTRAMTLPGPVLADKVEADYDNGVLTVRIPKDQSQQTAKRVIVK